MASVANMKARVNRAFGKDKDDEIGWADLPPEIVSLAVFRFIEGSMWDEVEPPAVLIWRLTAEVAEALLAPKEEEKSSGRKKQ